MLDERLPDGLESRARVASRLDVSVRTVDRLVALGVIPAVRVGRHIRFDWSAVKAALPPAGRARTAGLPPSSAVRRPIDLVEHLRSKARHWGAVPDELAARRERKEGRHGA